MTEPAPDAASPLRREMAGFATAGAAGFAVDAALTLLFVQTGLLQPVLARLPATAIAILVTYVLNRNWTFRSRESRILPEFLRYLGISLAGAAINYAAYAAFLIACAAVGVADTARPVWIFGAVAAGSAVALAFNFLGARYIAFLKRASAG